MYLVLVNFRAAQKLNLSSSPHRRRRSGDENIGSDEQPIFPNGYAALLLKSPPPAPPALLRRIGVKELTGVGKVSRHHLSSSSSSSSHLSSRSFERLIRSFVSRGEDGASSSAYGKTSARAKRSLDPPPIFHRIGFQR